MTKLYLAAACAAAGAWLPFCDAGVINFNRPTDTIRIPDAHTSVDRTMTIEAMVRLDPDAVFNAAPSGGNGIFYEQLYAGTGKSLGVTQTGFGGEALPSGISAEPTALTRDAWHHFAYVCDTTEQRLYLDGIQVASAASSGPIWNAGGSYTTIGASHQDGNPGAWFPSFIGSLDWLRVSSSARYSGSTFTVSSEPISDGQTLLLYNFNDPLGSTVAHDSGPNHWDGTLGVGVFAGPTSPVFAVPEPVLAGALGAGAPLLLVRRRAKAKG